ncbi:DUF3306 domain-containing protein [Vibrio coralliilyticus]|uniref:DUF3306 domain-containing protein n=1 Tax=Vibrio coralliilyticus TaxID=190893 RepID=A0AAP6ZKE3_9VIBR|nr:DUF3306 domain-containing protein [Vibrio coralliilyticus]ERB64227.1 hypothetical protein N779_16505 [Vibrio coralliilyticus OCN008]NOJ23329.1 DUF3306 domain-containing protein [Vibrio coralliilyticus]QIJ84959.1 DUF3306 domain-containing protein [Vibrio coralliilyticus OCN008]
MASSFISRWSKRKLDGEQDQNASLSELPSEEVVEQTEGDDGSTDNELEQDSEETSVAALLVSEAESAVKKAALRKLFLSGEFSEIDRLNDYDHDYKAVKSLSTDVAAKLREWVNQDDEQENSTDVESDSSDVEQPLNTENDLSAETDADEVGQNIPHKK